MLAVSDWLSLGHMTVLCLSLCPEREEFLTSRPGSCAHTWSQEVGSAPPRAHPVLRRRGVEAEQAGVAGVYCLGPRWYPLHLCSGLACLWVLVDICMLSFLTWYLVRHGHLLIQRVCWKELLNVSSAPTLVLLSGTVCLTQVPEHILRSPFNDFLADVTWAHRRPATKSTRSFAGCPESSPGSRGLRRTTEDRLSVGRRTSRPRAPLSSAPTAAGRWIL